VTKGCPDRTQRIKALGNAVVPQVVTMLGSIVMEVEKAMQEKTHEKEKPRQAENGQGKQTQDAQGQDQIFA
tara:strand:- start:529 stop:741 length:213 start_codon:yes stop_codon:yes gene_type:complete